MNIDIKKRICSSMALILVLGVTFSYAVGLNNAKKDHVDRPRWMTDFIVENWARFPLVSCDNNDWFEIHQMPGNVYALVEPNQDQIVISYLILGDDNALLLDTGMGIANIKDCVTQLTDKPIIVLNSHAHFDHTGGNYLFDQVMCYNSEAAIRILTEGYPHEEFLAVAPPESIVNAPDSFSYDDYYRVGKAPTATVDEGDVIDIGGRRLEVMYTPGHEENSIMLIDEKYSILFTGDTWYPGPLILCFEDSSFSDCLKSLEKAEDVILDRNIKWIYGSHNTVTPGTDLLFKTTEFMENISKGEDINDETEAWVEEMEYLLDSDLHLYDMDGVMQLLINDEVLQK